VIIIVITLFISKIKKFCSTDFIKSYEKITFNLFKYIDLLPRFNVLFLTNNLLLVVPTAVVVN